MTVYNATPANINSQKALLAAGDTLLLADGTYAPFGLVLKNGTPSARITIQAQNDGAVIFDGSTIAGHAFALDTCSYITLKGFRAQNASGSGNANLRLDASPNCILQRITTHDGASGNGGNIVLSTRSDSCLIEDCAGWGQGRYSVLVYQSNNCTVRRCWAWKPHDSNFTFAPRVGFGAYDSSGTRFENCYVQGVPLIDVGEGANGTFITSNDQTNYPAHNTVHDSGIYLDAYDAALYSHSLAGVGTIMRNCFVRNPLPAGATTLNGHGDGIGVTNPNGGTVSKCTVVESDVGFHHWATATGITLDHCSLYNNTRAVRDESGGVATAQSNYSGNGTLGITLSGTDKTLAPGYNTATFGKGGCLIRPATMKGSATDGGDMGCEILYQLVDGVLTSTPLWPWPMESRIAAEAGISPTYAANGGLWTTLNGVYGVGAPSGGPTINYGTIKPLMYASDGTFNPSGNDGETWNLHDAAHSLNWGNSTIVAVQSPAAALSPLSPYAARLTINPGGGDGSVERAELSHGGQYEPSGDWYYSFGLYVPSSAQTSPGWGPWTNVIQWMDERAVTTPPISIALHTRDGTDTGVPYFHAMRFLRDQDTAQPIPGEPDLFLDAGDLVFDQYIAFTLHIKGAMDHSGTLEVWRNGILVVSQTGIRTLNNPIAGTGATPRYYIEMQCYRPLRSGQQQFIFSALRRHTAYSITQGGGIGQGGGGTGGTGVISRRAVLTATGTNGTSISTTLPSTVQTGDVAYVNVALSGGSAPGSLTGPAGWTRLTHANSTGSICHETWRKVLAPAEAGTTVTWSWTGTQAAGLTGEVLYNVDTATPEHVVGTTNVVSGGGPNVVANSLTTTIDGCRILHCHAYAGPNTTTFTPPNGWAAVGTGASAAGATNDAEAYMADFTQAAAGAVGQQTAVASAGTNTYASVLIAVKPALTGSVVHFRRRFGGRGGNRGF